MQTPQIPYETCNYGIFSLSWFDDLRGLYHTALAISPPYRGFLWVVFALDFQIPYKTCSLYLMLSSKSPMFQRFLLRIYRIELAIWGFLYHLFYVNHIILYMINMLFCRFFNKIRLIPYRTCNFLFSGSKKAWNFYKKFFSKPFISPFPH